jgi:RimJ/RimL family protein N-acetyltransferase
MVGIVKVTKPDGQKDYVRFGHLLISEDYRGRGYGSQAIHLIEDLAFNVYRVKYLELGVFSFNQKAKRLYERLGYEVVGVRKDDKDSNFDSYTMRKSRDA